MTDLMVVDGLTRRFGGLVAVDDVSFTLAEGEILGLIGPNGAGKTTCFNLITGFLNPDSGQILLNGKPVQGLRPFEIAREGMVRTFQHTTVFPKLSVHENLMFGGYLRDGRTPLGAFFGTSAHRAATRALEDRVGEVLALFEMEGRRDALAADLSYGELRHLEIALAMMAGPKILLLDEPAAGLNPHESEGLRRRVLALRDAGHTIVLIEHNMNLVMGCCDRLVVLNFGKRIAEGSPETVRRDPRVVEVYLGGSASSFASAG